MKIRILPPRHKIDFHGDFEPNLWRDADLLPEVREALLRIAEEVFEFFKIPPDLIEDIRFTGSLANYNYTKYSDIDLHIVVDFLDISEDTALVKQFFDSRRVVWNQKHNITIKGYEVEVYVENLNEQHFSSGIYSITRGEWITKPPSERPKVDVAAAARKTKQFMRDIDAAIATKAKATLEKMKEKIKKMRRCGLEKGGEYSAENVAFKSLRRNGYVGKLHNAYTREYDKSYSLPEEVRKI